MSPLLVAPLAMAVLLVVAALAKLRSPGSALSAMRSLRVPVLWPWLAAAVPYVEIALALGLLLPAGLALTTVSLAILALMVAYWGLIARGLTMHPRPSCGCFGALGSPVTPLTLLRNTMLVGFAVATVWLAAHGRSAVSLLVELDAAGWGWLFASVALAATGALVVASERLGAAPARPEVGAATMGKGVPGDDDDVLDYVRVPIPPGVLLREGEPTTLLELASRRPQLLLWLTCGCGRSREVVNSLVAWREALPAVDVRVVSTLSSEATKATFPEAEDTWLRDHGGTVFAGLGLTADPAAVLLGADGLLAGGPVYGKAEIEALVNEMVVELAGGAASVDGPVVPDRSSPWPGDGRTGDPVADTPSGAGGALALAELASDAPVLLAFVSPRCDSCVDAVGRIDDMTSAREVTVRLVVQPHAREAARVLWHHHRDDLVVDDAGLGHRLGVAEIPAFVAVAQGGAILAGPVADEPAGGALESVLAVLAPEARSASVSPAVEPEASPPWWAYRVDGRAVTAEQLPAEAFLYFVHPDCDHCHELAPEIAVLSEATGLPVWSIYTVDPSMVADADASTTLHDRDGVVAPVLAPDGVPVVVEWRRGRPRARASGLDAVRSFVAARVPQVNR